MMLTKKNLLDLPVYTESGQRLGRVVDFELDIEKHLIARYHVKSRDLIKGLLNKELIIANDQVISVTAEKMIVEDAMIAISKKVAAKKAVPIS